MKKRTPLLASLLLCAAAATAQTQKQLWSAGWDNFGEPLDLNRSNVSWSMSPSRNRLGNL